MKISWKAVSLAAAAVLVCGLLVHSLGRTSDQIAAEEQSLLRQRIVKSAVLCYSLEGRYPDSVAYLEENYGVIIDHQKYNVFYETIGSNLKPDVQVYRKGRKP